MQEFYDSFADYQLGYLDRVNPRFREIRKRLKPILARYEPNRGLDVGCGIGVQTDWLAGHVPAVTGVDTSPRNIQLAKSLYERPTFVVRHLPSEVLPEGPYDVVTVFDVLEHVTRENRVRLFERIADVISEDGVLVVNTPSKLFSLQNVEARQIIEEAVGGDEVVALAARIGFEPLTLSRYGIERNNQYMFAAFGGTYDIETVPPPPALHVRLQQRVADVQERYRGRRLRRRIPPRLSGRP